MNDLFFLPVLNRSLSACWLILAVLLLRVLFKKAPAYLRIVLWVFVGFRLIIPFDIKTDLSLIPSAKPLSEYTVQYETDPKIDSGIRPIDEAINPVFTETFKADPANSVNPLYVHTSIAGIVWILGIAILLLCSLISHCQLKKRLSDSIPLDEGIRLCDHIETPFVYGLFKPMIYLPSSLNEKDREIVLKHEKMHIARRDHFLKPLAYLISIVHWFNPLVWLSYHLFCKDIEIACDEAVIKDMTLQEKKDYSKTLLSCAAHKRFVFSYPLAFGEVGIKERVKNVLDYKKPSFWIILAGIVICIVTGVCFLTNPKHNPDASYLLENFDRENIDDITIMYDFDYSEYESTDRFYSKEAVLSDLDPKDQKRIMRQIESILRDEEFEEVPREEIRGEGSLWRLLILDSKKVNISVYEKEGYIGTKDPESDIGWPMVYKVNNDKLNKLCEFVNEIKPIYDRNYGIMFHDEMTHIIIRTDYKKTGEVLELYITDERSHSILNNTDGINSDPSKEEEEPLTYYAKQNEDGTYFERMIVRFYAGDFDANDARRILKYLGLKKEYSDYVLSYNELINAESFIYRNTIVNGEKITNISFDGDPKYEFKE